MLKHRLAKLGVCLALIMVGATFANITFANGTASAACEDTTFLTFRPWYFGLRYESASSPGGTSCELRQPVAGSLANPATNEINLTSFVWKIVFNIIDIMIGVITYAAVLFVLIGGFNILMSSGDPGKLSKGKQTITNAVLGIAVALLASGVVRFINDTLLGGDSQTITISANGTINSIGFRTDATESGMWFDAVGAFLMIAGIGAVLMVVWGGIKLSMSAGDPQAAAKAKNTIIFALIGAVIMIAASFIVRVAVSGVTGAS